jgi:ABC-type transport system involved in multi-copper enzyme maturation permease subunit
VLLRVFAVATNAYREAVRARVLAGLFGLAFATCIYALVAGGWSVDQQARVLSDVGAASMSLYGVLVAIVLGATSLHRELELKTLFPILARPLHRSEYLVGKYGGTLLTLLAFLGSYAALLLAALALVTGQKPWLVGVGALLLLSILGVLLIRAKYTRVYVLLPWSLAAMAAMAMLAETGGANRRLLLAAMALAFCESAIIAAVATLFSSFSSPFLTAIFTFAVFVIGRSADTLAHLPPNQVGEAAQKGGAFLAHVFPNLHLYVPPRPLLLGELPDTPVWPFVGKAALHAVFYSVVALVAGSLLFRRRDFT